MTEKLSDEAFNLLNGIKRTPTFDCWIRSNVDVCKKIQEYKLNFYKEKYKKEIRNNLLDEFLDSFNFKE